MNRLFNRNKTLIFIAGMAVFLIFTLLFDILLSEYDISVFNIPSVLTPILGMAFGLPAISGCAVGGFIYGIFSNQSITLTLLGLLSQFLYGLIPYILWRKYVGCSSAVTRIDSLKKVTVYVLITILNTVHMALVTGLIKYITVGGEFSKTSLFAFVNCFTACVFFGMPLLALFDYIYSNHLHKGKRRLSVNEIIILVTLAVQLVSFLAITVISPIANKNISTEKLWHGIFILSLIAFAVAWVLSFIAMVVLLFLKKKNASLRIAEKPNGTVFVDEKRSIEFVSFPAQPLEYRIKADTLAYTYENARADMAATYENAWYTSLSTQKGCRMKCSFCDCPAYGYHGNLGVDDFKYQINTILDNAGTASTGYFRVDFMRMGEPTLNREVLNFIEFDLQKEIKAKVDARLIVPCISTMMPKNNKEISQWLPEYCRIKNEIYDGNAELQLSISSTDEECRRQIFKNCALSLKEISEIAKSLPSPKGSKYYLNFPITKDTIIDAKVIDSLFDKSRFAIKLTPMHETFNAIDNGFKITTEYKAYDVFEPIEKSFTDIGWDVFVYLDKKCEDDDGLTCGNLLLPNINDRISDKKRKKKKVGLVVAIELNAIFELYDNVTELESSHGFRLFNIERDNCSIYVVQSGMGECAASAACQLLISKFNVSSIINFGVVGGLTPEMKQLKVCLVDKVVHYKYDCSEFMPLTVGQVVGYNSTFIKTNENLVKTALSMNKDLQLVTCCSGDKFIGTEEEKKYLHDTFKGDICDMESAGIVLTCDTNKVPCILFKAVSDGLADGANGFYAELDNASKKCLIIANEILDKIATVE